MSVRITYFVHGTTTDNEEGRSTGQLPGKLSKLGVEQSEALRAQLKEEFAAIFCSDLDRAVQTAAIVFPDVNVLQDQRLRECDYGELNGAPEKQLHKERHIEDPFLGGESYTEVERRMHAFLKDLSLKHDGDHIAIIAHQAPQLALEVLTKGKSWQQAFREDWRRKKKWQPSWNYTSQ